MRSSCSKEDSAKKYASYSNTGIAECTKTSIGANQYGQPWQQHRKNIETTRVEVSTDKSDTTTLKTVDNLALHHSIKPCQFTFLTAVKRKLALGGNHPTCKKNYELEASKEVSKNTMEFIKPLKVPDLKILPKADFSSCESLLSNEELAKKIEAVQRDEMALKNTDRVPRKLEFSSSSTTSLFNYENIEPLKVPDFTISKKKDLSRDSSREKENKTKRVKKDDFQNVSKWPKTQKHISRKDIAESVINRKLKNERILAHGPKECDMNLKKCRTKSLASSVIRKDDDKRYKLTSIPLAKAKNKTLDSRASTSSSESLYTLDKGTRLHDKILIREGYKAMISEINDRKHKDDSQVVNTAKQSEEQKYKSHSESRLPKHQSKSNPLKPIDTLTRDQSKRIVDKQKSFNKIDSKHSSEISEDLTTAVTSIASLAKSQNLASETSISSSHKSKDIDKSQLSSNRNNEDPRYSNEFLPISSSDLMTNSSIIETKLSQDSSLSERLMDPVRISFRDNSYSNQPEFADLVTPDINLTIRSKRRKALQERDNDTDLKESKQSSSKSTQDSEQTPLSSQQKTNINMIDSFSESLQQVIDSGRSRISSDEQKISAKSTEFDTADLKSHGKKFIQKTSVKVAEVQTQTANDIATQTDVILCQAFSRVNVDRHEVSQISLDGSRYDGPIERVEDISIPNRMRTTSEISMYETTSSIKTETGTEISISTRDVTCSFNKYLDLEMAQLIKDERQRYDKIEMLFKSREKTLNDKTKKLIKLEEQKRALRDTGQDSRISSVKKKQRALLLKLQQEKDEMNRLKELHKIASQERKLMLQKQRDMFNPEMSTKNILNKLKRSADSQSPRRLSGPMKGYDIRSNSSISSLVDSDKSQLDRSHFDFKLNLSDISPEKNEQTSSRLEAESSQQGSHIPDNDIKLSKVETYKQQKDSVATKLKYDLKTRKFEEKMPKSDKLKQYDLDLVLRHGLNLSHDEEDKSISEHIMKSESDAIIEEFTQVLKSQFPDIDSESLNLLEAPETIEAFKEMQRVSSSSKKFDKEPIRKLQQQHQYSAGDNKNIKRKGIKGQKSKVIQPDLKLDEANSLDDVFRHHNKRSKIDSEQLSDDNYQNSMLEELDFNESQSSLQALLKHSNLLKERNQKLLQDINDERHNAAAENSESPLSQKDEEENVRPGNTSARSQLSLTISHQSSNDSDRSYSRSVVIRSQQDHHHHHHQTTTGLKNSKKLEQILRAREATLVSRRNCVEEWIAWHARLREEENRVARMEQAAYKLVSATAKALSHNDTTVSSDTSDVEGRIELLTQKLADRRLEMARLKKEARKQAKQRLRALEANLLNQIKKYDATIRDMRKKLEAKKGSSKEIEKLAVESKSVIDFKVPEIPIKKIQEIYKSSDLLCSKSDSDILTARSDGSTKDDPTKSNPASRYPSKSRNSEESTSVPSFHTINDELDQESSEKSDNSAVHSYKTKSNSEEIATQKSLITEREVHEMKRSSSQSSNISEEISSEAYSVKSLSEQVPMAKISEALAVQDASEKIESNASAVVSKKDAKESLNIEEELSPESDDTSLIFSRKLDHIQLHNKELNDDIHNLENDLKALTDMMSSFGKKSDKKSKSIDQSQKSYRDVGKSTSKDISEEFSASESNVQTNNLDEDLQARVKKILSDVVPETDELMTSIEELDVKTKKTEALDYVKKSQLPEHYDASVTEEISTHSPSHFIDNSEAIDAMIDIDSISEVISTAVKKDETNISPNEFQESAHKISKSINAISTQIDNTYSSNTDKFSSTHIKDINTDVSEFKSKEVSADQVTLSKIEAVETVESEIHTSADDKNIQTKITTTEEIIHPITEGKYLKTKLFTAEEISASQIISSKFDENEAVDNDVPVKDKPKEDKIFVTEGINLETDDSFNKTAETDNGWVSSDSFDIQGFKEKDLKTSDLLLEKSTSFKDDKDEYQNGLSDIENSNLFIPRGESTNLQDTFVLKLDETGERIGIRSEEFNDILEIIERETKIDDDSVTTAPAPAILNLENDDVPKSDFKTDSPIEVDVSIKTVDESESIEEEIEGNNEISGSEEFSNEKSLLGNDEHLPQLEIDVKIQLVDEGNVKTEEDYKVNSPSKQDEIQIIETKEAGVEDRVSSDGEQKDNLIEVAEGKLDVLEKSSIVEETSMKGEVKQKDSAPDQSKTRVTVVLDRTFEIIKDPEYEDISEESLEVSEILDRSEMRTKRKSKKFSKIPEKYVIKSKSDEVLRILDELSNKTTTNLKDQNRDVDLENKNDDLKAAISEVSLENQEVLLTPRVSPEEKISKLNKKPMPRTNSPEATSENELKERLAAEGENAQPQQVSPAKGVFDSSDTDGMDTPSGISEIEVDSPRAANENSRLDIDALDDDLLSGNSLLIQNQENETKTEFHTRPMGVTSEKDIKAMIHKLQASLEQPGIEFAAFEAKLLQIENLKIELEIKKLEAEEVSYYFREIPNKPPPPYTPPGAVRLSSSFHDSPSPPPVVVPASVEELAVITDRISAYVYAAKQSGEHVPSLEAPAEVCELGVKEDGSENESLRKDRRIYNLFLFDLCKELVVDMYRSEYEEPGPSWTKLGDGANPGPREARSLDELSEYVSKEVATLLGFKTKLQRENLVMRWSRKRRDRVDELLAKEAQAEEKEWTKYDYDELAVKNEMTMTMLNNLITETTKSVKAAYAKKRKLSEAVNITDQAQSVR